MNTKLIVTHPGVFHADEVCAVAYLRLLGCDAPVDRRIPTAEELADNTVMCLDVGGENDRTKLNFDHHQRGGAGERWDSGIPFSSFGLVVDWMTHRDPRIAERFIEKMVLPVDATDNGWGEMKGNRPMLSFSYCVHGFNPVASGVSPAERDAAFWKAVDFAKQVLTNAFNEAEAFWAARDVVMGADTAVPQDSERTVLVLDEFVPWDEHIFSRPDQKALLYVVFPSERGGYMLQQVPQKPGSFAGRKPLPLEWAGLRDQDLAKATGIADAVFCHNGRFCGGAASLQGTLDLARLAVED